MKLDDKTLAEFAKKHLRAAFPNEIFPVGICKDCLDRVEHCLDAIIEYFGDDGQAPHSLFRYQANADRNGEAISLRQLWKQLNNCAVILLRWYDRRDNVGRKQDHIVTAEDNTELAEYFFKVTDFEKILYGADIWYRDHFAHVIRVWMVGVYVVYELENEVRPPDVHPKVNSQSFDQKELFAAFTIAALCHDLGYPIEKTSKLNDKISDMFGSFGGMDWSPQSYNFTPQRHELGKLLIDYLSGTIHFTDEHGKDEPINSPALIAGLESIVAEYSSVSANTVLELSEAQEKAFSNRLRIGIRGQHTYQRKYSDSLEGNDHGILSAMILMRKVRYFKEGEFDSVPRNFLFEEVRQYALRRDIFRACASHTCRDIYYLHPLTIESLLFFCDELQEWGRPRFSDLRDLTPENLGALEVELHEYSSNAIRWTIDAGTLDHKAAVGWCTGLARKFRNALAGPANVFDYDGGKFQLKWEMTWIEKTSGDREKAVFVMGGQRDDGATSPYTFNVVNGRGEAEQLATALERKALGFDD